MPGRDIYFSLLPRPHKPPRRTHHDPALPHHSIRATDSCSSADSPWISLGSRFLLHLLRSQRLARGSVGREVHSTTGIRLRSFWEDDSSGLAIGRYCSSSKHVVRILGLHPAEPTLSAQPPNAAYRPCPSLRRSPPRRPAVTTVVLLVICGRSPALQLQLSAWLLVLRREARAEGVVRVVTFKGSRRASVVVPVSPSAESRGASLAAFLTSPACHGALLDAPLYYQVEGAAPYTYKCQARRGPGAQVQGLVSARRRRKIHLRWKRTRKQREWERITVKRQFALGPWWSRRLIRWGMVRPACGRCVYSGAPRGGLYVEHSFRTCVRMIRGGSRSGGIMWVRSGTARRCDFKRWWAVVDSSCDAGIARIDVVAATARWIPAAVHRWMPCEECVWVTKFLFGRPFQPSCASPDGQGTNRP